MMTPETRSLADQVSAVPALPVASRRLALKRRSLVALALACLTLATVVPTTSGECSGWPIRAAERLDVGYAFAATVTEVSDDVDPTPDMANFDWHVELAIDRTYLGQVPDSIAWNGWDNGCHELRGGLLQTGDKILVATEDLNLAYLPGDPFDGDVIVWRSAGASWLFYADAMLYASDEAFYPHAARTATTTADVLRLITTAGMPGTSTLARPDDWHQGPLPAIALIFLAGFVLAVARLSRPRRN